MEYIGSLAYDKKLIEENKKIIIFGAGNLGEIVYKFLCEVGRKADIVRFCDNNEQIWNTNKFSVPVCSPAEVFKKYKNDNYVIASKYCVEIAEQLVENQIDNIHLIRF